MTIKRAVKIFIRLVSICLVIAVFLIFYFSYINGNDYISPYDYNGVVPSDLSISEYFEQDTDSLLALNDASQFISDCKLLLDTKFQENKLFEVRVCGLLEPYYEIGASFTSQHSRFIFRPYLGSATFFNTLDGEKRASIAFFIGAYPGAVPEDVQKNRQGIQYVITNDLVKKYRDMVPGIFYTETVEDDYIIFFPDHVEVYFDDELMGTFDAPKADQ